MIDGAGMCGGCRVLDGKSELACVDGHEFDELCYSPPSRSGAQGFLSSPDREGRRSSASKARLAGFEVGPLRAASGLSMMSSGSFVCPATIGLSGTVA
jgi:dihydroorotate dehydrogenase B-like protein